jgi:hypothetical protein
MGKRSRLSVTSVNSSVAQAAITSPGKTFGVFGTKLVNPRRCTVPELRMIFALPTPFRLVKSD